MKIKVLLIIGLLISAVSSTFGQAAIPMATPNATETYALVTDGNNSNFPLKWNVYLPPNPGQYPAVLVIFGGEFKDGDRSDVGYIASYIASQGFVALAIDYRVDQQDVRTGQQVPVYAPPAVPNQPGDVKLAVTAARTGVIPGGNSIIRDRITGEVGAVGGSSGASHALWCAATGSLSTDKLNAAVLFSGAYEFDDQASLTWCGLVPPCDYGPSGPKFRADVYRYCGLNPNNQTCMTPLPSPTPFPALTAGSPIYQVHSDVSPLYYISDPGDLITPYQFSDLHNVLTVLNVNWNVFKEVWLGSQTSTLCNHSFDNWPSQKNDVIAWLHARLDN